MIKAVILDFDDTLCLTEEQGFENINRSLEKMGRPLVNRETFRKHWGKDYVTGIQKWSPGIDVETFKGVFHKVFEEGTTSNSVDIVPEQNLKALDTLIERNYKVIVLTSRTHPELKHVLQPDNTLMKRVEAFYYKDNTEFHKPDPRAFSHIEAVHGWSPRECVYVGDSIGDANAAKGAGLHFIASLESGIRTVSDFKDYNVDAYIYSFPEICNAIKSLETP